MTVQVEGSTNQIILDYERTGWGVRQGENSTVVYERKENGRKVDLGQRYSLACTGTTLSGNPGADEFEKRFRVILKQNA